jgi:hypothetical protein
MPSPASSSGIPRLEEVVVLALAADRLARAISVDEVSEPLRRRCHAWAATRRDSVGPHWVTRLLDCPLCTGWWVSLAVSLAAPGRRRLLRGAAVSGAQVMLSLAERLVSEEGRVAIERADLLGDAVDDTVDDTVRDAVTGVPRAGPDGTR